MRAVTTRSDRQAVETRRARAGQPANRHELGVRTKTVHLECGWDANTSTPSISERLAPRVARGGHEHGPRDRLR